MEFLEILLYICIGFWLLTLLLRWASPYIFKFFIKQVGKKAEQHFKNQGYNPNSNQPEHSATHKVKDKKEKVGEYIDFEEID